MGTFRDGLRSFREGLRLTLLLEYVLAFRNTGWEVFWGATLPGIVFGLYTLFVAPSKVAFLYYLLFVVFVTGYYLWKADHLRLMPKLTVSGQIKYHRTPTADSLGRDTGSSIWIQLSPKCLTDVPVEQCSASLREVRRWSEEDKKWKSTDMNESLPLGWSFGHEKHLPITLEPGNERRLNVLTVHSSNKLLIPVTYPLPLLWGKSVFNEKDTFLFDITLRGKDCPPIDVYLTVKCGSQWDEPIVDFTTKPDASNLSS
jgi:hypothetical protein